jgi:S-formylglutathione hydrolase FrmB
MKLARFATLPLVLFILSFATALSAEISRGTVQEKLTIESKILGRTVNYSIYLPGDYATSSRAYPIVYLLHGLGDNDTAWIQFGEINRIADKAISKGEIAPMIIVTPDAGRSWYVNSYDGKCRYEDFFFNEFIPAIESKYRVLREKRFRGIAGLSMGGNGSLIYCMKHPDMFAACAAFSSGIHTAEEVAAMPETGWNSWNNFYAEPFGEKDMTGQARLTKTWHENSVLEMVKNNDRDRLSSVRYYIDCGDDDFLCHGNCALHLAMLDRGIPHEYRMRNGGHQWSYWRSGIKDGLAFISESFHQN